jgi:hypothetical protein
MDDPTYSPRAMDGALPSYERLFGDLDFRSADESRSVYSPAAYLADLLQLLEDHFDDPALVRRRPGIERVPLDADNTYTELPYLDIVNEVLAGVIDAADAYEKLRTLRIPIGMPFSLRHERLKTYLEHLRVSPAELYSQFATPADPDTVARLHLGLSSEDVDAVTTPLPTEPDDDVRRWYQLGSDALSQLDVDAFRRALSLSAAELRELLFQNLGPARRPAASKFFIHQKATPVTLDTGERSLRRDGATPPVEWFERVIRFVRLARKTGLSFTDLDLILRSCCENRIDGAALRTIAMVTGLQRSSGLPVDVVCSLAAPIDALGFDGTGTSQNLFDRVFNASLIGGEPIIVPAAEEPSPTGQPARRVLTCSGDVLAPHNKEYRRRLAGALALSEGDLTTIVERFRARSSGRPPRSGPFDRDDGGLADLSLLHRVSRLVAALGTSVGELLDVLDVLESDPSIPGRLSFPVLIEHEPRLLDCYRMLDADDAGSSLWLAQALFAVVPWMQAQGFTGQELVEVVGAGPARATEKARGDGEQVGILQNLASAFEEVALAPGVFLSDRFGERASEVVHDVVAEPDSGVVSRRDARLLRLDPAAVEAAAYDALVELGAIAKEDFLGLGLGERLSAKVFSNLVHTGVLEPDGMLVEGMPPPAPAELPLATDFSAYRDMLFELIGGLGAGEAEAKAEDLPAAAWLYPSDLATLDDLTDAEAAELYDNLVFNGYISADGEVLRPDFFAQPDNAATFAVNADLDHVAPAVLELLRRRVEEFRTEPLALDPEIFAPLALGEAGLTDLLESLRFNGYIDADGLITDKTTLAVLDLADLNIALEFYPHRRGVLDAVQAQIAAARAERCRFTPEDFADAADDAVAQQVVERLDGTYLVDDRVPEELRAAFADPASPPDLGEALPPDDQPVIAERIATILRDEEPYRLDLAALEQLGFDAGERDQLVALLVEAGHLTGELAVARDRLAYFGNAHNALELTLTGLEDYSKDIFFLLHAVATELTAGVAEITATLATQADRQVDALFAVLQDAFGLPAATVEAICIAVTGSRAAALERLVAPVLAATDDTGVLAAVPADSQFRITYRRIRRFALLAAKLGLDATEVRVAFDDQDLVGKLPEPLALPPGEDRIDALLTSGDGNIYLFGERGYWTYSATTYALSDPRPRPLSDLSGLRTTLARVDAAFTDAAGTEWIVGRGSDGTSQTFIRERGSTRWAPKAQVWGTVRNNFADPARIDAAYVDDEGRTYLFCGDQYVRYSRPDYTEVDEGYPRSLGEWWAGEGRQTPLPPRFRASLDAAFRGKDGSVHMFAGDRCLAVADGASGTVSEAAIPDAWGRIRNNLAGAERVDAAYADASAVYLFSGDQVVRYSDSVENDGVRVDDGYPQRIESHFGDVPMEFKGGLDAAFVDPAGVVHLFRDGKTVSLSPGAGTVVPTAERWGVLGPVLPSGTVDAGFVGLDGKTYLFSGDQYLRYSGADYAVVDVGYPRGIAGDWGGLRRVDASFVMDGRTYLFGTAGRLLELPVEHEADLDAGRISAALRQRLAQHGLTIPERAQVEGQSPQWRLTAEHGIGLTLTRTATTITVSGDETNQARFYVRYSTRDYTKPDEGHPRPLADDWWNLPAGRLPGSPAVTGVDAVFTGRDNRTYLFSGSQFVVFDGKRRWWSEPQSLRERWDSLPFERVDAAFVGTDGKTYVFSGPRYVRFSDGDYTKVDDRYPAPIPTFWGKVVNNIARTGQVDAALVVGEHTYLFSGNQYVRYTGHAYGTVDAGYPKSVGSLAQEPRFANLGTTLDGPVDAAFADRRNLYLFSGRSWRVVSDALYGRYDQPAPVGCALVEDGSVLVEEPDGWRRSSAIEGVTVTRSPVRPRTLRAVPAGFRTGLDAVLRGADGNTYLFKGTSCFDVQVQREYPLAEEWGRPRNTIQNDNAVDAAFLGRDGRTYLFRGDQFVAYADSLAGEVDGGPLPLTRWGGLTSVTLAYVEGDQTYLFERPDPSGTMRYVRYSGTDYTTPDPGYPRTTDAGFWEVPDEQRPVGFTVPDAVLFEGGTMLLVSGEHYLQRTEATGSWSHPRPLTRIWRDLGPGAVTAAFTARDGATHFFFDREFTTYRERSCAPRRPIREVWGRSRNNFLGAGGSGRVDAAFVQRGVTTFLFSGDQYVRYTGGDYRFVDPGYPKPLAGNLRKEAPFAQLPEAFEDVLAERAAAGGPLVDAVVANQRSVYLFAGGACHVVSQATTATYDIEALGRVRNTVADRRRVDAALVTPAHTFLFSGDQYVRYTGADYRFVDSGYPRMLESSLAGELGIAELPEQFRDGIDAAFRGPDGATYLFAGRHFLRAAGGSGGTGPGSAPAGTPQPIGGTWGRVRNQFTADGSTAVDAAFVAASGALYAFRGGQYVRYRPGVLDAVEEGYPRSIRDDWGDLPASFEDGVDGAFVFEGRTYLSLRDQCVRYSDGYRAVDRTYPQSFRQRWSDSGDYWLNDIYLIARFVELARAHPGADGGLAAFLAAGPATVEDPYAYLAELFGWDADEIRWVKRQGGFLAGHGWQDRLDVELVLKLHDLFALTDRLGAGPSRIHGDVWQRLYGEDVSDASVDAALAALYELLARGRGADEWRALSGQVHDELNARKRDALVAAVIAQDPAGKLRTSRDLFERFLIDVDMGNQGRTSRVREAIAATQLYLHRYLLNLEPVTLRTGAEDAVRQQLRTWWSWMRTYRVWEANRKVFLYPENYLRPELRATKTPAFRALESDLLQSDITPASVQRAYKRYLDEYTEVSRLTIAGGYVYAERGREPGTRSLVLFGRTKTDPRRYYYRRAEFRSADRLSTTWEPWLEVGVQIDADTVYPTHAFDRVFVFWTTVEAVRPDPTAGTTVTTDAGGTTHTASASEARHRVKIFYSFYNLNQEWVPAQELGTGEPQNGTISEITLSVRAPEPKPGQPSDGHGSIEVSCAYTVTAATGTTSPEPKPRARAAFALHPELYAVVRPAPTTDEVVPDIGRSLATIFGDGEKIDPKQVVRFSNPTASADTHWFSVDHKGGSFLCRPAVDATDETLELPLKGNKDRLPVWDQIDAGFELGDGSMYLFDNAAGQYIVVLPDDTTARRAAASPEPIADRWGRQPPRPKLEPDVSAVGVNPLFLGKPGAAAGTRPKPGPKPGPRPKPLPEPKPEPGLAAVDAAWVRDGRLYLTSGSKLYRYTLGKDGTPGQYVDAGYPRQIAREISAAFDRDGILYLLSGNGYARLPAGQEPDATTTFTEIAGNWAGLPADAATRLTGSLDTASDLYLFLPGAYAKYPKGEAAERPSELATVPREIVRLTSGTAATLNQLLLSGGVPALLAPETQEIDEIPRFRTDLDTDDSFVADTTVTVRERKVTKERLPASSHLDFESANGLYYWEIFFHAPLLIAQALNGAQRFEDARRWYEYVFDPTQPTAYWRFLPFLAVDVDALTERLRQLKAEADALWPGNRTLGKLLNPVLDDLETVAPAFRQNRRLTDAESEALSRLASTSVSSTLAGHERKAEGAALRAALHRLQETTGVIAGLRRQYDLMGDPERLLKAYQEDPFDPHAIADLRPVAYRRAVVMTYIDNLLDWGDMLFRQYTAESIDEARMLYIFAYDLLGARPESLGTQLPPAPQTYEGLEDGQAGSLDLRTDFITGGGALLRGEGAVHRGVAHWYFYIPDNSTFDDYWARVEDRLRKIRQSLNILGISQPVPLFEPPIEPMLAVQAAAAGAPTPGAPGVGAAVPVPHHRFTVVFRKAQELVDRLRQLGGDLLGVLERRDAEELGLLQSRQEGVILGMTRGIKEAEVRIAAERLEELRAAQTTTIDRVTHFEQLIAAGPSQLQKEQIAMMTSGKDAHFVAAGLKIAAAIANAAPQIKAGPFIIGIEIGGEQLGGALDKTAEVSESFGEAFSMAGELLGVQAELERAADDWRQQLATAKSDLVQIGHQVAGAEQQLAAAEREAEITVAEIAHHEAVATFLKSKFGNAELYQWMSARLAGLYFDAYHLAYETARSAERAFQFERGVPEREASYIRPVYWESRRSGLLAGDSLGMDLERLGKAYFDGDARGLEISKRVSLLELDPAALMRLKSTGTCELALTEALFDRDFPGHFRRQIRTVTVTFAGADDQPVQLNATLTQLGHKTVMAADPKAVKHLLDPKGLPPDTVRTDWRPNQQIALSYVDERSDNNGLFELRFDDERYLPFEGTGAVSTWRLRLAGGSAGLAGVRDVVLTVRYSADDGGEVFATAVRGMLKPYAAARFFDVAAEFPEEWEQFLGSDEAELVLPFTPDMFPGMASREITGIYPTYDLADGDPAQFVLDGERTFVLDGGRLVPTPGLRVGGNGASGPGWTLALDGDKQALRNVGLVLTYKAGVP